MIPARPIAPGLTGKPGEAAPDENPFQPGLDDDSYHYREPARERYLNLLLHLAPYSDVLLVIGEPGSGKTYLLRSFLSRAADTWRVCQVHGEAGGARLLDVLDKELSLRPAAGAADSERLQRLRQSLRAQRRGGLVPLVIVDDADHLTEADLSLLAGLTEPWEGGEKLLGVLLFGGRALEQKLAAAGLEPLRARISHAFELPPLTERDTAAYIDRRLSAAGLTAEAFTPSVNRSIYAGSGGLPGRINQLAEEVLRSSRVRPLPEPPPPAALPEPSRPWLRYILVVAATAALLSGIAVYRDQLSGLLLAGWDSASQVLASLEAQRNAAPPRAEPSTATPAELPVPTAGVETVDATAEQPAEQPAVISHPPVNDEPADQSAAVQPTTPAPEITAVVPAAVPSPPPVAAPPVPPKAQATPRPVRDASITSLPDRATAQLRDEAWLLAQPAGRYTVQLVVKGSQQSAEAFVATLGPGEAAIYRTPGGQGETLYAVVQGIYSSYEEARAAAGHVSGRLRGVSPWVRSIDVVQRQIEAGRAPAEPQPAPAVHGNPALAQPPEPPSGPASD